MKQIDNYLFYFIGALKSVRRYIKKRNIASPEVQLAIKYGLAMGVAKSVSYDFISSDCFKCGMSLLLHYCRF